MNDMQLLAISGSIRRLSANTALLRALRDRLHADGIATLTLHGLEALPLFNFDLEGGQLPEAVRALQDAVRLCDGLVISSPEYNYGMSGVLKNALDWASRPSLNSPLKGKPVLVMSAASATTGGVRSIHQVRDTLVSCLARVIARPDVVVAKAQDKLVDGRFEDRAVLDFAVAAVADLVAEIRLLRLARQHEVNRS